MLGERLCRLRTEKKLTQSEVAKRLEMARTTYSGYENGSRKPDPDTLQKLADFYGVTVDFLLTGRKPEVMYQRFNPDTGEIEDDFISSSIAERLIKILVQKNINFNELIKLTHLPEDYLPSITAGNMSLDTLGKIADCLNISTDYLLGRTDDPKPPSTLKPKDELDIAKRMEKIRSDLMEGSAEGDGLSFKGEPMSEEAIESLLEALEHAERIATLANKKYTPKKYRDRKD